MAVPEMEAVLEFLRKNGLLQAEDTLKDEIAEKGHLGSFDFEKFFFPMVPPPPPVRIPSRPDVGEWDKSSDDQFLSLESSPTDACSSDFVNPYGLNSSSTPNSKSSSDRLSQFGTARAYQDLDLLTDVPVFDDKSGEGHFMSPPSRASESFLGPSEDKFVMTSETNKQESMIDENIDFVYSPDLFGKPEEGKQDFAVIPYSYGIDAKDPIGRFVGELNISAASEYGEGKIGLHMEKTDLEYFKPTGDVQDPKLMESADKNGFKDSRTKQPFPGIDFMYNTENEIHELDEKAEAFPDQEQEDGGSADDMLILDGLDDEYDVFDLRVVHRKNRTGFEENKDIPIVINTVVAGRYYVTEYLGSAAFSKVVQAHDLHTGVDVCLKIIKNDKDFFDQSLDEIKLLKLVNKHDPADEHHILRLYDYFYHQEHLFIVCELLCSNLYEYQKFNQESGGAVYFSLSRLQVITRQCLEALEYLHGLGIIHCDLKPENILIKSYRMSEIKIIDLGSSCFKSDTLCLYVQSRSYRAPEVILGLPYDEKIDLWSLGCILAELSSGEVLFPNDMVVTILARMMAMFGPIDLKMLMRGQETHKYFTEEYELYYINEETEQVEFISPPEELSLENHLQVSDVGFIDFVRSLLEINPKRRPTAKEALAHPWLSQVYPRAY